MKRVTGSTGKGGGNAKGNASHRGLRVVGAVALVLGVLLLAAGIFTQTVRAGQGASGAAYLAEIRRQEAQAALAAEQKAIDAVRKSANAAVSASADALAQAEAALAEVEAGIAALESGDAAQFGLYFDMLQAQTGQQDAQQTVYALRDIISRQVQTDTKVEGAVDTLVSIAEEADEQLSVVAQRVEAQVGDALRAPLDAPAEAMAEARAALSAAQEAVDEAYAARGMAKVAAGIYAPQEGQEGLRFDEAALADAQAQVAEAQWMAQEAAQQAGLAAALPDMVLDAGDAPAAEAENGIPVGLLSWMADYYLMILFTAVLLLIAGITGTFFPKQFIHLWKRNQVFSTFIALIVLMVVQVYAMKFTYPSAGQWVKAWFDNTFNVLRANTSVGMIALGMTLVIITGGIDLAVGSTLAGVGTVVMMLVDTSPRGLLLQLGITGLPAYALGVLGGLLTGMLIGSLIGLGVTKGRVPPFIITLGVMNIVRSLSQYVTKSYTPKVPTEFTAISNTVVFGQRLLPILYWLVLSIILMVVMRRTRFGRYVYAVGSNERTTRLSGINTDRVKMKVYTLMGLLVSIASITQVARLGGMDVASSGSGYELDAIAAVVVGGTSMSGGRGSILGTVIGVLIIGVMNNLLILLGVDSFLTNAFKGAIVIAAVLMQRKEQAA